MKYQSSINRLSIERWSHFSIIITYERVHTLDRYERRVSFFNDVVSLEDLLIEN
ncbi:hypothetical protein X777_07871 [Ooceraea biroi]|uniref:Uncharacterized protein n=1 Tax=Ooceraea biroi TaxID=2015173 RepID=A0A026X0C9_OOCBI|nr:hypothetical protein X777_07871 [Ooceraea biroi]